MPGDRQLGNDPFEAVQALVRLVRALVRLVRSLLSLGLALQDEFFEAIQAFVPFQDGCFKAVQAFVGSVCALLGLGLTSRDEFDGLFDVHPIEYSNSLYAPAVVAKAGCQAYTAPVWIPISRSPCFLPLSRPRISTRQTGSPWEVPSVSSTFPGRAASAR